MFRRLSRGVKKFWAAAALLSVEMVIILTLFFCSVIAFAVMYRRIFLLGDESFDQEVFGYIDPYITDQNTRIMNFITFFGKHDFLIPANLLLIAYFLFVRKHRWYSIKVPAIAISSLAMMFGLKRLFNRPRPLDPILQEFKGLSFPSGHALMSVTFYGLLIYLTWHLLKDYKIKWPLIIFLVIWILLVGFSRIYLRAHNYSDVIAGFSVGVIWLYISLKVMSKMEKYSKRNVDPVVQQPTLPEETKPTV
jgi:membrane-associated phospholipid phosphatase